ncbi:MAG: hypothetical protein GY788_28745 [bacterium]|nr:hypothetical protein [bacterium]
MTPPPGAASNEGAVYVGLCASLSSDVDAALWSLQGHEIEFEDVLRVRLSQRWALNSAAVLGEVTPLPERQVVPVVEQVGASEVRSVEVRSVRGVRHTESAVTRTVKSLVDSDTVGDYISVSLDRDEFETNAEVVLSADLPGRPPVSPFALSLLRPISRVEIRFNEGTELAPITIRRPDIATVEVIGIRINVDWSPVLAVLAGHLERLRIAPELPSDEFARSVLESVEEKVTEYSARVDNLRSKARNLSRAAMEHSKITVADDGTCSGSDVQFGSGLDKLHELFCAYVSAWDPTAPIEGEIRRLDTLCSQLEDMVELGIHCALSLDASSTVDPRGLRDGLGTLQVPMAIEEVVIPFTTESEPGTQGKRSAILLFFLAVALMAISVVDLSWLIGHHAYDIPHKTADPLALVEPIVAVLILFPGMLYAQFFQTRPMTPLGARAELGTFAFLSLVFALPLIPAVLAATGFSFCVVSFTCFVLALVALGCAIYVWRLFKLGSLARMRADLMLDVLGRISAEASRTQGAD